MKYRELLLGCGHSRQRLLDPTHHVSPSPGPVAPECDRWQHVTAVDINPHCRPDYVMDLERGLKTLMPRPIQTDDELEIFRAGGPEWTIADNVFNEVHAYEVLEHLGQQGDVTSFLGDFDELWRALKPGGWLCATVPSRFSPWMWADPGHRRAILPETLMFLSRVHYAEFVGRSHSSDYRPLFIGDWDTVYSYDNEETHKFILQAVKPARSP